MAPTSFPIQEMEQLFLRYLTLGSYTESMMNLNLSCVADNIIQVQIMHETQPTTAVADAGPIACYRM